MLEKQHSLFDHAKLIELPEQVAQGKLNMQYQMVVDLNTAIKNIHDLKGYSRARIAAEMTDLLFNDANPGEITKSMLDSWTSESKKQNRFPAEFIPAFVHVTGAYWILERQAKMLGCIVLKKNEAIAAELGAATLEVKRAEQFKQRIEDSIDPKEMDAVLKSLQERQA